MLTVLTLRRWRTLPLAAAVLALAAAVPAPAQEERPPTKVFKPDTGENRRGTSSSPAQIVPQLHRSLQYQRQALGIALQAQSEEQLKEAGRLTLEAYFFNRAAHAGVMKMQRANTRPESTINWEDRVLMASRNNLTAAQNEFKNAKLKEQHRVARGIDFLREAISQTESVAAIHR